MMFRAIQIQTIDKCNLKCSFCPNSYLKQTGKLMDKELYRKIINQLAELKFEGRISPYLMNESLLDKRSLELIVYTKLKLPKAQIMINTNGTMLTPSLLKALLKCGMDRLNINCYSENVYNRVKTLEGVSKIHITPWFKKKMIGFYNRAGLVDMGKGRVVKKSCARPFTQMYIDYWGKALLCCSDYKREVIMGDVNKEKLIDIWQNNKYKKYRKHLALGERNKLKLCNKCNYGYQVHSFFFRAIRKLTKAFKKKI